MAFHLNYAFEGDTAVCVRCKVSGGSGLLQINVTAKDRYERQWIVIHRSCLDKALALADKAKAKLRGVAEQSQEASRG